MIKRLLLLSTLAFSCFAPQSRAATVEFTLYLGAAAQGPGTFKLTAQVGGADNFGLVAYGVQLVDSPTIVGGILSVNHDSLRAAAVMNLAMDEGPAGFTVLRSADLSVAGLPKQDAHNLAVTQDTLTPTPHLIRGFGQSPSSLALQGLFGSAPEGDPWGNAGTTAPNHTATPGEFELARGTYTPTADGGLGFIPVPSALTFATVFTSASGIASMAVPAGNITRTVVVPEPVTIGLAGLGLLYIVLARRPR